MRSISPDLARHALDAAPDAMFFMDDAGRVLFANARCATLFGHSHAELVRRRFEHLVPDVEGQRRAEVCAPGGDADVPQAGRIGRQVLAQRGDGSQFPAEISVSAIDAPEGRLTAVAVRDVSERKRVESELVVARVLAEHAQAAADAARASADRANLAKSRFLATASHDLRQPLQALALLNRTLRSMIADPGAQEALVQQDQNIRAMSRLMNALLDVSKLESGAVKAESVDFVLAELFAELAGEFSRIAADKGLSLAFDATDARVRTDRSLLEEVLRNLVGNALKYTIRGGVVVRAAGADGGVRIEVCDSGIGIAPDHIGLIFEEFYQVGSGSGVARQGYGLGLSIVQRIAVLLGTRVTVRSAPGLGSTFSLVVPAGAADARTPVVASRAEFTQTCRTRAARVLLVEDDPAVRGATELLLSVEGHEVIAVARLEDARRVAAGGADIDLLITDFHLAAGETGVQVIEAVRRIRGAQLKAVLVTGDTSSLVRRVRVDENLRMLSKPVDADELLALIADFAQCGAPIRGGNGADGAAGGAPSHAAAAVRAPWQPTNP